MNSGRRFEILALLNKLPFREGVTGAAFQILLNIAGEFHGLKRRVELDFSRLVFGRVSAIKLFRPADVLENVSVEYGEFFNPKSEFGIGAAGGAPNPCRAAAPIQPSIIITNAAAAGWRVSALATTHASAYHPKVRTVNPHPVRWPLHVT